MAATGKKNGKTVVVALGGNAILQPGQVGTFEEQLFNIDGAMRRIASSSRTAGASCSRTATAPRSATC